MPKEIKLTGAKGGYATVSAIDYKSLSKHNWSLDNDGYARGHAEGITINMHTFIMKQYENIPNNMIIDHINKNRLDNRRENLRLLTVALNNQNRTVSKNKKSSIYACVVYDKKCKKYKAETYIGGNGKSVYLGLYNTEIGAAEAFDMYIVHNNYSHVGLNFPNKKDEYLKRKYVPYNKNKQCKYVGVVRSGNRFVAIIHLNKKRKFIKYSNNEEECAEAYDSYIVENNIPEKKLNFPENHPTYNPNTIIKILYEETDDKNIIRLLIKSAPNKKVYIDKEEYVNLKYYSWHIASGYVCGRIKNGKYIRLHHYVMKIQDPNILIDHIDSNTLNNCKSNLRISDDEKNAHNKSKSKNASSKYFGISVETNKNKWRAQIVYHYTQITIGFYSSEILAARARDLFILIHHKNDDYKLNFDDWTDKNIAHWKKKIIAISANPDKWIAKTHKQQIISDINHMADALENDKFLMLEKLNKFYSKKFIEKREKSLDELGFE